MAIIGVLILQAGLVGVKPTTDQLVAYGALFGVSQQLFTTFVDLNANQLMGQLKKTPKTKTRKSADPVKNVPSRSRNSRASRPPASGPAR
jgi:hypothetical protein